MLTCVPRSICSWDYHVRGAAAGPAGVAFDWLKEDGGIVLGPKEYSVQKQGWLSGRWTLEGREGIYAEAYKPSAMFRSFELSTGGMKFILEAQSPFVRAYNLLENERLIGEIRPVHAFTRRAEIECTASLSEPVLLFSFWLVLLTWKRAASNNSGSS